MLVNVTICCTPSPFSKGKIGVGETETSCLESATALGRRHLRVQVFDEEHHKTNIEKRRDLLVKSTSTSNENNPQIDKAFCISLLTADGRNNPSLTVKNLSSDFLFKIRITTMTSVFPKTS